MKVKSFDPPEAQQSASPLKQSLMDFLDAANATDDPAVLRPFYVKVLKIYRQLKPGPVEPVSCQRQPMLHHIETIMSELLE